MHSSSLPFPVRKSHFAAHAGWLLAGVLLASLAPAQDLNKVLAVPVVPPQEIPPAADAVDDLPLFAARPGEKVILPRLLGARFVTSPEQMADSGFPSATIDVSHVPELQAGTFTELNQAFLDRPASRESLDRLAAAARIYLRSQGRNFVTVYLPPQDITAGYVQIVVNEARAAGAIRVSGAHYFSSANYLSNLHQAPGAPIDEAAMAADLAWLNRNPFRRVVAGAEAGAAPGTTQLTLRTQEQRPLTFSTGYDNTGTTATDEDRLNASVTWGNAFGRGDLLSYRFTTDPDVEKSVSHSATYTAFLPWRNVLTLFGAYSRIESRVTPPFAQEGHSWQIGSRYEVPLAAPRAGWAQNLTVLADFKYSDNNLEFATIPISNNVTHIAQLGVSYTLSLPAFGGQNSITATGYGSPGGLTHRNRDSAFNGSRPGAKAEYVYAQLNFSHTHPLPRGFSWWTNVTAQIASGALLGSEQLNGGGSAAVRGYAESSAFGDEGVVMNNELHIPGFAVAKGHDTLDPFVFVDFASLNQDIDHESTDLRSAGLGANYHFSRWFSLRAVYGWQLTASNGPRNSGSGHGHISAAVTW